MKVNITFTNDDNGKVFEKEFSSLYEFLEWETKGLNNLRDAIVGVPTLLDTDVFCSCKDKAWHYWIKKKKYCHNCCKPRRIS